MKRQFIAVLIGVFGTAMLFSGSPARAEENGSSIGSTPPIQTEKVPAIDPANALMGINGPGRHLDKGLRFETGTHQKTPAAEREAEALRLHQTTLLDRFQGADAQGQAMLSFSEDRIDLKLRSITGAEAPVAGMNLPSEK